MDLQQQGSAMASQVATMVVVMVALVSSKLKRHRREDEPISYGPRLEADEHREKNLLSFTNQLMLRYSYA
jgi:hypothetical protein